MNASANRLHNAPFTILGSVLCAHLSPESRVPHDVFQGIEQGGQKVTMVSRKEKCDAQSQSEH